MRVWLVILVTIFAPVAHAAGVFDVYLLGEVHDNPAHHQEQARRVAEIAPRALVLEMVTAEDAAAVTPELRADATTLRQTLRWDARGWPDFSLYYPIFAAAPTATLYGALVPREAASEAIRTGAAQAFGADATLYGLSGPLPEADQQDREALQFAAHCDALPPEMLPGMVEAQRLRDAVLARAVLRALDDTGGPVAVITGNGHARRDWGVPSVLARVAPHVTVHALGQGEDGVPPDGTFDEVVFAPAAPRDDPCAAFR